MTRNYTIGVKLKELSGAGLPIVHWIKMSSCGAEFDKFLQILNDSPAVAGMEVYLPAATSDKSPGVKVTRTDLGIVDGVLDKVQ